MSLSPGTRLGPYEILSPLGAGGMGEVYKAKDTRLERTVAVKVLPQHLSSSAEVRQRFEREAKTISQLSHSHICALYDVGREGDTEYLVMEYLEGETLSDRLAKGPLPLEQVLRYGVEIADALDKAHRQGIVHRDLKPGNVMLTRSGVKLLDFGLAKAMAAPKAQSEPDGAADRRPNLTQEGTILGTFQYMAPEQLEGKEADARSDIFAFGAVLYEMATGQEGVLGREPGGADHGDHAREPPPISSVLPTSPPALDRVVLTCLAKDPEERWQSRERPERELRWIGEDPRRARLATAAEGATTPGGARLAWTVARLSAAAVLALAAPPCARGRSARRRCTHSCRRPRRRLRATGDEAAPPAISPDGGNIVFGAAESSGAVARDRRRLPGRERTREDSVLVPGRPLDRLLRGRQAQDDRGLGRPRQGVCDAPSPRGGTWGPNGSSCSRRTSAAGCSACRPRRRRRGP